MRDSLRPSGTVGRLGFGVLLLAALSSACGGGSDGGGASAGAAGANAGAPSTSAGSGGMSSSAGHAGVAGAGAPSAGSGGSGGSGGAGAYSRAGLTCTTLGEDCSLCDNDTVCLLALPYTCVPKGISSFKCGLGTCSADKPYCLDGFCMTLNDASCFCTGSVGKTVPDCAVSPADQLAANMKANQCHAQDAACGSDTEPCCSGTACAGPTADTATCAKICTKDADCSTNCCAPLAGGSMMICAPATNCQ